MLVKQKLLGVDITVASKTEILESLLNHINSSHTKTSIVTPNPEIIMYAQTHLDYQSKLNSADIALPDGVGVVLASKLLGKPIKHRITGVDFMLEICERSREKPISIGLLGGGTGVAESTAKCLLARYPWLTISFIAEEWPLRKNIEYRIKNNEKNESSIHHSLFTIPSSLDILFVAFGAPKQEEWIFENLHKLPIKAAMGVGGAFDYLSGNVKRAPKIVRIIGLEWLFRLVTQPRRWKRQLALFSFIKLILQERFRKAS